MKLDELFSLIKQETRLKPEWADPNYLADLLPRLASYYSSLGEFLASAEKEMDAAEITYKVERETEVAEGIRDGATAAASAALGVLKSEVNRREFVNLKYKARLLSVHRQSLQITLDALRSKLSFLKRDREQ